MYNIYTDGSCSYNGTKNAKGGWAYIILDDKDNIIYENSDYELNATNQRMEMKAILEAMQYCVNNNLTHPFGKITINTDSAYVVNCFKDKWYLNWKNNNWKNSKKQPVANQDYWEMLIDLYDYGCFYFNKVKGHSNNQWNNYVDELAVSKTKTIVIGISERERYYDKIMEQKNNNN